MIDFGIAKESAELIVTRTLARSVSHGYSPPEQVFGTGTDQRSDVYALGATMDVLLTGTVPLAAHERVAGKELAAPRSLNPVIPSALDAVILQALDLNIHRRPQTIEALSRAFAPDPAIGAPTVRIAEISPIRLPVWSGQVNEPHRGLERRGRGALWIGAVGLIVVGAFAAWRLLDRPTPPLPTRRTQPPRSPVPPRLWFLPQLGRPRHHGRQRCHRSLARGWRDRENVQPRTRKSRPPQSPELRLLKLRRLPRHRRPRCYRNRPRRCRDRPAGSWANGLTTRRR